MVTCPNAPDWCGPGDPYLPHIGDIVRHRNGCAPWLVIAVDYGPNPIEMVIGRREVIGVVEGVRRIDDYQIEKVAK